MRQSSTPTFLTNTMRVNNLMHTMRKARDVKKNRVATIEWFLSTTANPPIYHILKMFATICCTVGFRRRVLSYTSD